MFKIFDTHTHTYPETIAERACESLSRFYDFPVDNKGTYADLEAQAKECGVGGFLIFCVATNAHQVENVNNAIAATVEKSRSNGFKTLGYAGMHQDFPDFESEIKRVKSLGLKGVKLHPDIQMIDIDDKKLLPLYDILSACKIKLYLHMGDDRPQYRFSSADKLAHINDMFPELEITAAHFGGYKAFDEAVPMLAGRKNIYYDTSSSLWLMSPEHAKELMGKLGYENMMFGTDYPVMPLKDEIERFMKIDLSDDMREDILWNNASRYYGFEEI